MKKNRFCILCNFGPYLEAGGSVGGSEAVIAAISEGLIETPYNYEIDIYAHNYTKISKYNNINLIPCSKGDKIIDKIAHDYSHVFVYSDSQWNMGDIIQNVKKIDCRVFCVLVGAYYLRSHPDIFGLLKKNIDKFNLITHSSITSDYKWCVDNNLPVKVISNGICLGEFKNNTINFREKYKIKEKIIILNISNWFYGKGQNALGLINKELKHYLDDFIIVQISSSIKYPYEQQFLNRAKRNFDNEKCLFLRNIPREDVIAAFKNSSVFLNVSLKEVSPIVILESLAAGLPFISLPVGDVSSRPGVIVNTAIEDKKGYKIIDKKTVEVYAQNIYSMLINSNLRNRLIEKGHKSIEQLDWKNIVPEYDRIFNL